MSARIEYQPALDGLRGLLVAVILIFHAGFAWASGGYLGVPVFFTLSGYLIMSLLRVERGTTGRIALGRFWERRARRLLPASLLGIALAAAYGIFAADVSQLRNLRADGLWAVFYGANWRFLFSGQAYENLFAAPSPLLHYWSLAIEEQFYLVFPLAVVVVLAITRGSWRVLGSLLALLALSSLAFDLWWIGSGGDTSRIYYGTDARAGELLAGGILALVLPPGSPGPLDSPVLRRRLAWVGAIAFVALIVAFASAPAGSVLGGALSAFSFVSAGVVAGSLVPGPVRTLLSFRPLRELGNISYGVYVFHWPVFLWLDESRTGLDPYPLFLLRLCVVLPLGFLSNRLVESPIRRAKPTGRRALPYVGAGMLATCGVVMLATLNPPAPSELAQGLAATSDEPSPGVVPSGPVVAVVGGSEAWSIWNGLNDYAKDGGGFRTLHLCRRWCGIARGGLQDVGTSRSFDGRCGEWAGQWRDQVLASRPPIVLLIPSVWDLTDRELPEWGDLRGPGDPEFDAWLVAEYATATDDALAGGGRAVWLTSACVATDDLIGPLLDNPALSVERSRYLNDEVLPRAIAGRPRAQVVDLDAAVCGADPVLRLDPPESLRPDGVHYSLPGSRLLAEWLIPQILSPEARASAAKPR